MNFKAFVRSLRAKIFRAPKLTDEVEEELRSHIHHRADDLERSGFARVEAERRARIEFGGQVRFREESREARGGLFFETLVQDARVACRVLRKSRGFTLAAVVTLALAIGANALVFDILDGPLLRPLNVPQTQSLWGTMYGDTPGWQSYPNYVDLRDRNHSFQSLAAFNFAFVGFDTGKQAFAAAGFATTGNYFDVLRVKPYLGRFFHSADEHGPNSAPYLVLSYAYWHRQFLDDRSVVGRVVRLDQHPFTIIGVAPPTFVGTLVFISPDFFLPIVNQEQVSPENSLTARGSHSAVFEVLGHLKPGVTSAQAVEDLNAVGRDLEKTYPKEFGSKGSSLAQEGLTSFAAPIRAFIAGLMLLAGLILLAACANLGGLFAAHAADRSREVALRLALGASRQRILRQLFVEALLISAMGGLLGLAGSIVLLKQLGTWQPFPGAPVHLPVAPDAELYVAALALALLSALLFGIIPVRQVLRTNPYEIVKSGSRTTQGRRITVRDLMLVVQIALCAVLVTSSLVALQGLRRALRSDFGFDPRNTMLVDAKLATVGYGLDRAPAMQRRMIEAMKTIPGVDEAGLVNNYPPLVFTAGSKANVFQSEEVDLRTLHVAASPYKYEISPGYLAAAGTVLLAGRDFSWHDDKNAPRVALVNRELAVRMFHSIQAALGRDYKLQDGTRIQVVGVVHDGKYQTLTEDQEPAMFLPFLQSPASEAFLLVRSHRDPGEIAGAMRGKLRNMAAGLPVDTRTWNDLLALVMFPSRMATASLGALGMMGAMLSITGIFGMAAYSVSKRLKELGIRVALGARRREVLQAALGRALKLLVWGSAIGLLLGILASRILASIVYQATPRDPLVLAGVFVSMATLGLLATWIPAQRALSVDPATLLREE